jgi:hypothetical protein
VTITPDYIYLFIGGRMMSVGLSGKTLQGKAGAQVDEEPLS